MGFDDFAADAEIAEHAFQRARIGIQFRLAERLAIRSLGAESTDTEGSSNLSDDLRAGARGAAFLRGARAAGTSSSSSSSSSSSKSSSACGASAGAPRPPRLGSCVRTGRPRRRRARDQPAIGQGQQPRKPRLRAHRGVKRPSQRDRAARHLLRRKARRRPRSASFLLPAAASLCRPRSGMSQPWRRTG